MSELHIETIVTGPLSTNSYVVWTETETGDKPCWLFDVSLWPGNLIEFLHQRELTPTHLFVTHGHGDHIGGVGDVLENFPDVKFCCPEKDIEMLSDPELNLSGFFMLHLTAPAPAIVVNPGMEFQLGDLTWKVLDTAGHTLGGVSYYCESEGVVFTGDALFNRSVGRTDIPNGSHETLVSNIRKNLLTLPGDTVVYPGHRFATTIEEERDFNPVLK